MAQKKKSSRRSLSPRGEITELTLENNFGLEDDEIRICELWIADPDRIRSHAFAKVRPGSTQGGTWQLASVFFKRVEVQGYIAARQKKIAERHVATTDKVIREIANIAFAQPKDFLTWDARGIALKPSEEIPPELAGAISSMSEDKDGNVTVKFHSKPDALRMLASHMNMDAAMQRMRVEGHDGGPVKHAHLIAELSPEQAQQAYRELLDG